MRKLTVTDKEIRSEVGKSYISQTADRIEFVDGKGNKTTIILR